MEDKKSKIGQLWKNIWGDYSIVIVLIGIFIVATLILGKTFFSTRNILNVLRNNSILGILSLGMAFVIVSGNIDLSVGSMLVAVGAVTIGLSNYFGSLFGTEPGVVAVIFAILCGVIVGALFGFINGFIITKGRVPSFIVTLGFMSIYRSVSMYFMKGGGFFSDVISFKKISNTDLFGIIPLPVIYLLIFSTISFYILKHTKFGRHVYAVGSNEKAARLSGINTDKVKIMTYVIMGIMVALAAITESSRMNSINATSSGSGYELNAITAVIIGGVSMAGGKGKIVGVIAGVLLLGVISNVLNIAGVNVFLVNAIKGALVILAVLLQKKEIIR